MASTFNLPMISHFCSHGATSNKRLYKTFARTRPPATIVTKSLASLLLRFNWTRISFFRPMSSKINSETIADDHFYIHKKTNTTLNSMSNKKNTPGDYEDIAISMKKMFKELKIEVR